jgi:hypothetical protein
MSKVTNAIKRNKAHRAAVHRRRFRNWAKSRRGKAGHPRRLWVLYSIQEAVMLTADEWQRLLEARP